MFILNGFCILSYFCFGVTFFVKVINLFCFAMGVTLDQYRACIGLFNSFRVIKCNAFWGTKLFHYCLKFFMFSMLPFFKYFSFSSVHSVAAEFQFFYMLYSYCIIMQSWYIEANPGPSGWRSSLFVCHWNLNSIWVEDFSKFLQK